MTACRIRICALTATLLASLLPTCALAADYELRLGTVGNVALENPFPTGGYGNAMARGDFDGDGTDDLAVAPNAGSDLRILYGQEWDVGDAGPQIKFLQTTYATPFDFDYITLASGDFDGDGRDELVVGHDGWSDVELLAGRVYVLRRGDAGTWSVQTTITQGTDGFSGGLEEFDSFGNALAIGDFDDDGHDDLAIGALGEDVSTVADAGAVMVAYGSPTGITAARDHHITRNSTGLPGAAEPYDKFGYSLASGDFDDDGHDDLAIGMIYAPCPDGVAEGGAVIMMLGAADGVGTVGSRFFQPGSDGLAGTCTDDMNFGYALAAGPLDLGFTSDLAIGTDTNDVHVLYSEGTGGLSTSGNQRFTPADVPGGTAAWSSFGKNLAVGHLRGVYNEFELGQQSLVVGATVDTVNGIDNAGSVTVIHAEPSGLVAATAERWTRSAVLRIGPPAENDYFGSALATGDWNGDNATDLAIGVPNLDSETQEGDGAVAVLYQSEFIFRDGFD